MGLKHALRIVHGLFAVYFIGCLGYLYYAAFAGRLDWLLILAIVSLAVEGFAVFILNGGDCPLIHIQRKIGDDKPFFELILPPKLAKRAIPIFAALTWTAVGWLILRLLLSMLK